jgi:hypothetical protein
LPVNPNASKQKRAHIFIDSDAQKFIPKPPVFAERQTNKKANVKLKIYQCKVYNFLEVDNVFFDSQSCIYEA